MLFQKVLNPALKTSQSNSYEKGKLAIEEKAIQKYPFTLNNQTYFASEGFYEDVLLNGVMLSLRSAKGIADNIKQISYLHFSQRLIFCAGANILTFSSHRKVFEEISACESVLLVKGLSLSSQEKQLVCWVETSTRIMASGISKTFYRICLHDMNRRQTIVSEKMLTIPHLSSEDTEILVYMHPIRLLAIVHNIPNEDRCEVTFKKQPKGKEQLGEEQRMNFPYQIRNAQYDLQSNSYIFIKDQHEIIALRLTSTFYEPTTESLQQDFYLSAQILLQIAPKERAEGKQLVQVKISDNYMVFMVKKLDTFSLQFYSVFSHELMFQHSLSNGVSLTGGVFQSEIDEEVEPEQGDGELLIKGFEFSKNILIVLRQKSTVVSIFILFDQSLRHVRDISLDLPNCYEVSRMFINPLSSEVLVVSRHYELEGTLSAAEKSRKIIFHSGTNYKSFYMEASCFLITSEASTMNVEKLSLSKKKYNQILTCPWKSDYIVQTENSIIGRKFEEKFDNQLRCSASHPMGIFIALGFNDCFKVYYVNHQGLEPTYVTENLKECASLAYSPSGEHLAAASTHIICIYDSYSLYKRHQFSLGMMHRVEEIYYSSDRLHCISQSKRIVVYNSEADYKEEFSYNPRMETNVIEGFFMILKEKAPVSNSKKASAIVYDEKTNVVIFSMGGKIHFMNGNKYELMGSYDFEEVTCMEICHCISTLFLGTASGKIIAYPWPNKPNNISSRLPSFQVHSSRVKRIKLSSDMFYLVSITEESLYVHSLALMKEMRKIEKYELQREFNPQSMLSLDFLARQGLCLFSTYQYHKKHECIKENEEEVVNLNFILPEEREKQKYSMLSKLSSDRESLAFENQEKCLPYKTEAINMKERILNLQNQRKAARKAFELTMEQEIEKYRKRVSELSSQKDMLNQQHKDTVVSNQREMRQNRESMNKEKKRQEMGYFIKIDSMERNTSDVHKVKLETERNFHELPEMEEEKQVFNEVIIKQMSQEIEDMVQRNGYLLCRNTNVEKEIKSKKRKIEELKDLVMSISSNIKALPQKKATQEPVNEKEQMAVMKDFALTEKKYLKETKKVIEKNKAVNVSISLYEKEKEILVLLEKQLEEEEEKIDQIIEYLQVERANRHLVEEKVNYLSKKAKGVIRDHQTKVEAKTRHKNEFKTFMHKVSLFLEGVVSLAELKRISRIAASDMVQVPHNYEVSIEEKKKRIEKILSSEDKIMNVMRNDRKIFSNEKKKSSLQNQDLLVNFNFLNHDNKHLANVLKNQADKKRMFIRNLNTARRIQARENWVGRNENMKNLRVTYRMKTSPCMEYDL